MFRQTEANIATRGCLQIVCVNVVQIVLLAALVMYLEPLVLLVVCPFALPYLMFRWRAAKQRYSEDTSWTTKRRWTRDFVSHLTGQQSYETLLGHVFGEHDLSGGQWQKLAVARALARNASLLILDEPTAC